VFWIKAIEQEVKGIRMLDWVNSEVGLVGKRMRWSKDTAGNLRRESKGKGILHGKI
jgi:hypothetical protein